MPDDTQTMQAQLDEVLEHLALLRDQIDRVEQGVQTILANIPIKMIADPDSDVQ